MSDLAVRADGLSFGYVPGSPVLRDLNVAIPAASLTCVVGPSGAGKSTLLYCLAGVLDAEGNVSLLGTPLPSSPGARARIRLKSCGFVFQRGELLPELTIVENVGLPLRLLGVRRSESLARARARLEQFGIAACAEREVTAVSGGQAQRASVARALIHEPLIVFADEPTGSLDADSRDVVVRALLAAARRGACVIVATHDDAVRAAADQIIDLGAGRSVAALG